MLLTKPFFYSIIDDDYVLRNPKYLTQEKTIYACNVHEKSKKPHNNTDQYFDLTRNLDNYYEKFYIITDRNG